MVKKIVKKTKEITVEDLNKRMEVVERKVRRIETIKR